MGEQDTPWGSRGGEEAVMKISGHASRSKHTHTVCTQQLNQQAGLRDSREAKSKGVHLGVQGIQEGDDGEGGEDGGMLQRTWAGGPPELKMTYTENRWKGNIFSVWDFKHTLLYFRA